MSVLLSVSPLSQLPALPTGCECVSAAMLLSSLGMELPPEDFIGRYITARPFVRRGESVQGADPRKEFAGDPRDPASMGCYAPVIQRALNRFFWEEGLPYEAVDATGAPASALEESLQNGLPVIYWATLGFAPCQEGPAWTLPEGETFTWRSNEHCLLLVGMDEEAYYFNDPMQAEKSPVRVERALAEARHAEQYEMAVCVRRLG